MHEEDYDAYDHWKEIEADLNYAKGAIMTMVITTAQKDFGGGVRHDKQIFNSIGEIYDLIESAIDHSNEMWCALDKEIDSLKEQLAEAKKES